MTHSFSRRSPGLWIHTIRLLAILFHFQLVHAAAMPAPAAITTPETDHALLTHLAPSTGTLSPAFSRRAFHYGMALPAGTASLSLTATAAGENTTLTVNGTPVASGAPSADIPLAAGANTITIRTIASDGTTQQSYHVTVLVSPTSPEPDNLQPLTTPSDFLDSPSSPENFTAVGDRLFFTAYTKIHGEELWVSDGTEAGTVMVKDINPGAGSSYFSDPRIIGDTLYFLITKEEGSNRDELWKTDGTAAGTTLIRNVREEDGSLNGIQEIEICGDRLYYHHLETDNRRSLWVTDGTPAGTLRVTDLDIKPWIGSAYLTSAGDTLYFVLSDGLWKTDGTQDGTVHVRDFPATPGNLRGVGDILYFTILNAGRLELWKSGGTAADTEMIKDFQPEDTYGQSLPISAIGSTIYFRASDGTHPLELWKSDGTTAGTVMLRDLIPDAPWSSPGHPVVSDGAVYFTDYSFPSGGFWKTDGTAQGTVRIRKSQRSLEGIIVYSAYATRGNTVYLSISGKLWKSDGTEENLTLIKDFHEQTTGGGPQYLTMVGDTLFFQAADTVGNLELWKSDGTTAGTVMVKDINTGSLPDDISDLTVVDNRLFFQSSNNYKMKLGRSDGTAAGTRWITSVRTGSRRNTVPRMTAMNGYVYFQTQEYSRARLWRSDGWASGTDQIGDFSGEPYPVKDLTELTPIGATLYFSANTHGYGSELWKSDGTSQGTVMVKDIARNEESGAPKDLTVIGDTLYFSAYDEDHGRKLWKSDGTEEGTVRIDMGHEPDWREPEELTAVGGTLYFRASSDYFNPRLWKSDGTAGGTVMIRENTLLAPRQLKAVGNTLYFLIHNRFLGTDLWKSDGTEEGTVLVRSMYPPGVPGRIDYLAATDDTLYFTADHPDHGAELWKTDGTEQGTVMVKDINPGAASASPQDAVAVNGTLYFQATDGIHGRELWKSDGTADGTHLVKDMAPGPADSAPGKLTLMGTKLFFVATTAATGAQLYIYDTAAEAPFVSEAQAHAVTRTSAVFTAAVTDQGSRPLIGRGIVYAPATINADPQIGGIGVIELQDISGSWELGIRTFEINRTYLTAGTVYAYRAYAMNSRGTSYGPLAAFATPSLDPSETWRDTYFENYGNTGPAADLADPDEDGIVNLLERAFRLHPLTPGTTTLVPGTGTTGLPAIITTDGPEGPVLTLHYIRLKPSTNSGITYNPQFASDPGASWQNLIISETVESIDTHWERVTVTDPTPNHTARFGRVRVTTTPSLIDEW